MMSGSPRRHAPAGSSKNSRSPPSMTGSSPGWAAIVIGFVAGAIAVVGVLAVERARIDDPIGAVAVHGMAGVWGTLATGIFAAKVGLTSGETKTFMYHGIALVIVAAFSFIGSLILYKVTDLIIPLRVDEEQEAEGLDISQHGETALGINLLGGAHANGKPKVEEWVSSGV